MLPRWQRSRKVSLKKPDRRGEENGGETAAGVAEAAEEGGEVGEAAGPVRRKTTVKCSLMSVNPRQMLFTVNPSDLRRNTLAHCLQGDPHRSPPNHTGLV